jgi:hypothetical protein
MGLKLGMLRGEKDKKKLTFPDIGIVSRGGEGGVKGLDRVSGVRRGGRP